MSIHELLFAAILFAASLISGLVGFGGNILALPLVSTFLAIPVVVPIFQFMTLATSLPRAIGHCRQIVLQEFILVAGAAILGLPVGYWVLDALPERPLKILLGIFVLLTACKGLYDTASGQRSAQPVRQARWHLILPFVSGIFSGAFSSGGPLIAIYVALAVSDKSRFRATMFALNTVTAGISTIRNLLRGAFTGQTLSLFYWAIPVIILSYLCCHYLLKRIENRHFNLIIYGVIALSGLSVLLQALI